MSSLISTDDQMSTSSSMDDMAEVTNMDEQQNLDEESNKIRMIYRNIRDHINENHLNFIDPNSDHIEATLTDIEKNFKNVKKPREAVSDSHVLLQLARLGRERIKNVHCEFRSFSNTDFMDKMKLFMLNAGGNKASATIDENDSETDSDADSDATMQADDDSLDANETAERAAASRKKKTEKAYVLTRPILDKFGSKVLGYFRIPPRPTFLLGSLEKEINATKKRRQNIKRNDENVEQLRTKIKELDSTSLEMEANSTLSETERIFNILKRIYKKSKGAPMCFYEFVTNPVSFSRTIENIFYVSFLVKDGYVKFYLDECNLPVLEPVLDADPKKLGAPETQQQQKNKKGTQNFQSMVQLTKVEWKEIIEVFGIQSAIISNPN